MLIVISAICIVFLCFDVWSEFATCFCVYIALLCLGVLFSLTVSIMFLYSIVLCLQSACCQNDEDVFSIC